jgi:hypothetical protein
MADGDLSIQRRGKLYRRLFYEMQKAMEEDKNVNLMEAIEASCFLLVNAAKLAERHTPNFHVRVVSYLMDLFDDPNMYLDDEKEPN